MMQIDSNTDGLVDFSEFVAAALHVRQLEEHDSEKWRQCSKAAFEKFDIDGDGYISSDELRMVDLSYSLTKTQIIIPQKDYLALEPKI